MNYFHLVWNGQMILNLAKDGLVFLGAFKNSCYGVSLDWVYAKEVNKSCAISSCACRLSKQIVHLLTFLAPIRLFRSPMTQSIPPPPRAPGGSFLATLLALLGFSGTVVVTTFFSTTGLRLAPENPPICPCQFWSLLRFTLLSFSQETVCRHT